jgi:hypothetical protein
MRRYLAEVPANMPLVEARLAIVELTGWSPKTALCASR